MNGECEVVGVSVVCQKDVAAGSALVIKNTMLTVFTGWSTPVTNASDEVAVKKICADFQNHTQF